MSEVTFAKSFLATLDKRPIKLAADHVSDPRKHPNQSPYILPKQLNTYPRKSSPTTTQQALEKSVTVTLKPMKTGETVVLTDISLDNSIHDIKGKYAERCGTPQDKIKLLLKKKPTTDLKTLKELGVEGDVELSVMIMGGTSAPPAVVPETGDTTVVDRMEVDSQAPAPESEKAQVEAETTHIDQTATEMLKSEEFWADLQGFLTQRLRNEKEGNSLAVLFKEAWSKR